MIETYRDKNHVDGDHYKYEVDEKLANLVPSFHLSDKICKQEEKVIEKQHRHFAHQL